MEATLNEIMQKANTLFKKGSIEYESIDRCVKALREASEHEPADQEDFTALKFAQSTLTHAFLYNMKINSEQSAVAVQLEQVITEYEKKNEKKKRNK